MTLARFIVFCSGFLLLCLVAVGFYAYLNLPGLVTQQVRHVLSDYGVSEVAIDSLAFTGTQLNTGKIWLRGEQEGLHFEVTLETMALDYNWRSLLAGNLHAVTIGNLEFSVREQALASGPASEPITVSALWPQTLIAQLPVARLDIPYWTLDYQRAETPPLPLTGKLHVADNLDLHISSTLSDSQIAVQISSNDQTGLRMDARLTEGPVAIARVSTQLQAADGDRWQWTIEGEAGYAPLPALIRDSGLLSGFPEAINQLATFTLQGNTNFNATFIHGDTVQIDSFGEPDFLAQFQAEIRATHEIHRLDYGTVINDGSAEFVTLADWNGNALVVTLPPLLLEGNVATNRLELPAESLAWLGWGSKLPVRLQSALPIQLTAAPGKPVSLKVPGLLFSLGTQSSEVRWSAVKLDVLSDSIGSQAIDTQLSFIMDIRLHDQQLPQTQWALQQNGSLEQSVFGLLLKDSVESFQIGIQGNINFASGEGRYQLGATSPELPLTLEQVLPVLQAFDLIEEEIVLSSGSVTLDTELESGSYDVNALRQQSLLTLEDVSGSMGEYPFQGIHLSANWSGIEQWKTRQPAVLSIAQLNVGFDIEDIRAQIALPKATPYSSPRASINAFSAGMFGGRVYLPEVTNWDFSAPRNTATLKVDNWQLRDIVALQQGQDIEAVGVLEGELPVALEAGRLIIDKGYLRALAPGGSIRYRPDAAAKGLAGSNSQLDLALNLLNDLRYKLLSSDVALDKEGNLTLALSLTGSNPAQYNGREVNFNINLEQNLDPLLQSLRLGDTLVEGMGRRQQ